MFKKIKKLISITLLFCFFISLFNNFSYGVGLGIFDPAKPDFSTTKILNLHENFGQIIESYDGTSDQKIFVIEDLHCDEGVQRNISQIIRQMKKDYGSDFTSIGIEGSSGEIDVRVFGVLPDPEIKMAVIQKYISKGYINGAELYAIEHYDKHSMDLYGIENQNLHDEDLVLLFENLTYNEKVKKILQDLQKDINEAKIYLYTDELKKYETDAKKFETKKYNFTKFIEFLKKNAESNGINLNQNYPNLQTFLKIEVLKKEINEIILQEELKIITKKLDLKINENFNNAYELGNFVMRILKQKHISLTPEFKELNKFFLFKEMNSNLDALELLDEIDLLDFEIKEKIADDRKDCGKLLKIERYSNLLLKYLNNETSKTQTELLAANIEDLYMLMQGFGNLLSCENVFLKHLAEIKKSHEKMKTFYKIADKREELILKNILRHDAQGKIKALIVGGYHSRGIAEYLRGRSISYEIIRPSITSSFDKKIYLNRLEEEYNRIVEKDLLIKSKNLHELKPDKLMVESIFTEEEAFSLDKLQTILNIVVEEYAKKFGEKSKTEVLKFLESYLNALDEKSLMKLEGSSYLWQGTIGGKTYALSYDGNVVILKPTEYSPPKLSVVGCAMEIASLTYAAVSPSRMLLSASALFDNAESLTYSMDARSLTVSAELTADFLAVQEGSVDLHAGPAKIDIPEFEVQVWDRQIKRPALNLSNGIYSEIDKNNHNKNCVFDSVIQYLYYTYQSGSLSLTGLKYEEELRAVFEYLGTADRNQILISATPISRLRDRVAREGEQGGVRFGLGQEMGIFAAIQELTSPVSAIQQTSAEIVTLEEIEEDEEGFAVINTVKPTNPQVITDGPKAISPTDSSLSSDEDLDDFEMVAPKAQEVSSSLSSSSVVARQNFPEIKIIDSAGLPSIKTFKEEGAAGQKTIHFLRHRNSGNPMMPEHVNLTAKSSYNLKSIIVGRTSWFGLSHHAYSYVKIGGCWHKYDDQQNLVDTKNSLKDFNDSSIAVDDCLYLYELSTPQKDTERYGVISQIEGNKIVIKMTPEMQTFLAKIKAESRTVYDQILTATATHEKSELEVGHEKAIQGDQQHGWIISIINELAAQNRLIPELLILKIAAKNLEKFGLNVDIFDKQILTKSYDELFNSLQITDVRDVPFAAEMLTLVKKHTYFRETTEPAPAVPELTKSVDYAAIIKIMDQPNFNEESIKKILSLLSSKNYDDSFQETLNTLVPTQTLTFFHILYDSHPRHSNELLKELPFREKFSLIIFFLNSLEEETGTHPRVKKELQKYAVMSKKISPKELYYHFLDLISYPPEEIIDSGRDGSDITIETFEALVELNITNDPKIIEMYEEIVKFRANIFRPDSATNRNLTLSLKYLELLDYCIKNMKIILGNEAFSDEENRQIERLAALDFAKIKKHFTKMDGLSDLKVTNRPFANFNMIRNSQGFGQAFNRFGIDSEGVERLLARAAKLEQDVSDLEKIYKGKIVIKKKIGNRDVIFFQNVYGDLQPLETQAKDLDLAKIRAVAEKIRPESNTIAAQIEASITQFEKDGTINEIFEIIVALKMENKFIPEILIAQIAAKNLEEFCGDLPVFTDREAEKAYIEILDKTKIDDPEKLDRFNEMLCLYMKFPFFKKTPDITPEKASDYSVILNEEIPLTLNSIIEFFPKIHDKSLLKKKLKSLLLNNVNASDDALEQYFITISLKERIYILAYIQDYFKTRSSKKLLEDSLNKNQINQQDVLFYLLEQLSINIEEIMQSGEFSFQFLDTFKVLLDSDILNPALRTILLNMYSDLEILQQNMYSTTPLQKSERAFLTGKYIDLFAFCVNNVSDIARTSLTLEAMPTLDLLRRINGQQVKVKFAALGYVGAPDFFKNLNLFRLEEGNSRFFRGFKILNKTVSEELEELNQAYTECEGRGLLQIEELEINGKYYIFSQNREGNIVATEKQPSPFKSLLQPAVSFIDSVLPILQTGPTKALSAQDSAPKAIVSSPSELDLSLLADNAQKQAIFLNTIFPNFFTVPSTDEERVTRILFLAQNSSANNDDILLLIEELNQVSTETKQIIQDWYAALTTNSTEIAEKKMQDLTQILNFQKQFPLYYNLYQNVFTRSFDSKEKALDALLPRFVEFYANKETLTETQKKALFLDLKNLRLPNDLYITELFSSLLLFLEGTTRAGGLKTVEIFYKNTLFYIEILVNLGIISGTENLALAHLFSESGTIPPSESLTLDHLFTEGINILKTDYADSSSKVKAVTINAIKLYEYFRSLALTGIITDRKGKRFIGQFALPLFAINLGKEGLAQVSSTAICFSHLLKCSLDDRVPEERHLKILKEKFTKLLDDESKALAAYYLLAASTERLNDSKTEIREGEENGKKVFYAKNSDSAITKIYNKDYELIGVMYGDYRFTPGYGTKKNLVSITVFKNGTQLEFQPITQKQSEAIFMDPCTGKDVERFIEMKNNLTEIQKSTKQKIRFYLAEIAQIRRANALPELDAIETQLQTLLTTVNEQLSLQKYQELEAFYKKLREAKNAVDGIGEKCKKIINQLDLSSDERRNFKNRLPIDPILYEAIRIRISHIQGEFKKITGETVDLSALNEILIRTEEEFQRIANEEIFLTQENLDRFTRDIITCIDSLSISQDSKASLKQNILLYLKQEYIYTPSQQEVLRLVLPSLFTHGDKILQHLNSEKKRTLSQIKGKAKNYPETVLKRQFLYKLIKSQEITPTFSEKNFDLLFRKQQVPEFKYWISSLNSNQAMMTFASQIFNATAPDSIPQNILALHTKLSDEITSFEALIANQFTLPEAIEAFDAIAAVETDKADFSASKIHLLKVEDAFKDAEIQIIKSLSKRFNFSSTEVATVFTPEIQINESLMQQLTTFRSEYSVYERYYLREIARYNDANGNSTAKTVEEELERDRLIFEATLYHQYAIFCEAASLRSRAFLTRSDRKNLSVLEEEYRKARQNAITLLSLTQAINEGKIEIKNLAGSVAQTRHHFMPGYVYLLGHGGRVLFSGEANQVHDFYAMINPILHDRIAATHGLVFNEDNQQIEEEKISPAYAFIRGRGFFGTVWRFLVVIVAGLVALAYEISIGLLINSIIFFVTKNFLFFNSLSFLFTTMSYHSGFNIGLGLYGEKANGFVVKNDGTTGHMYLHDIYEKDGKAGFMAGLEGTAPGKEGRAGNHDILGNPQDLTACGGKKTEALLWLQIKAKVIEKLERELTDQEEKDVFKFLQFLSRKIYNKDTRRADFSKKSLERLGEKFTDDAEKRKLFKEICDTITEAEGLILPYKYGSMTVTLDPILISRVKANYDLLNVLENPIAIFDDLDFSLEYRRDKAEASAHSYALLSEQVAGTAQTLTGDDATTRQIFNKEGILPETRTKAEEFDVLLLSHLRRELRHITKAGKKKPTPEEIQSILANIKVYPKFSEINFYIARGFFPAESQELAKSLLKRYWDSKSLSRILINRDIDPSSLIQAIDRHLTIQRYDTVMRPRPVSSVLVSFLGMENIPLSVNQLQELLYTKDTEVRRFLVRQMPSDWELRISAKYEDVLELVTDARDGRKTMFMSRGMYRIFKNMYKIFGEDFCAKLFNEIKTHEEIEISEKTRLYSEYIKTMPEAEAMSRAEKEAHEIALEVSGGTQKNFYTIVKDLEFLMGISEENFDMLKIRERLERIQQTFKKVEKDVTIEQLILMVKPLKFYMGKLLLHENPTIQREVIISLKNHNAAEIIERLQKLNLLNTGGKIRENIRVIFVEDLANYEDASAFKKASEMLVDLGQPGQVKWVMSSRALEALRAHSSQADWKILLERGIGKICVRDMSGRLLVGAGYISDTTLDELKAENNGMSQGLIEEKLNTIFNFNIGLIGKIDAAILQDLAIGLKDSEMWADRIQAIDRKYPNLRAQISSLNLGMSYEETIKLISMNRFIFGAMGITNTKSLITTAYPALRQVCTDSSLNKKITDDISSTSPTERRLVVNLQGLDGRVTRNIIEISETGKEVPIDTALLSAPIIDRTRLEAALTGIDKMKIKIFEGLQSMNLLKADLRDIFRITRKGTLTAEAEKVKEIAAAA